jgi:2-polyprenyl-6-hydroxyphenyl methylase/3-demethylubiquinone-9 3-methyltransferase
MTASNNVHPHEIQKFGSRAQHWWDPEGELKTLHAINPLRMEFIRKFVHLQGLSFLDVGCGGGILTEALAKAGAVALGIDLSDDLLDIADLHGLDTGIKAEYRKISVEALAEQQPAGFDHVVCMEMLEHVPNPGSVVKACATLVKPGGMVFFSTLNRVPKAYVMAIVAAEFLLKMLPKGTHDYQAFIKPSELCQMARGAGLELQELVGIDYHPLTKQFSLGSNVSVNYLAAFVRSN